MRSFAKKSPRINSEFKVPKRYCVVAMSKSFDPRYMVLATNLETDLKDKDYCPIEIIKGLTDKGQFQYLTKLMGPQEGTYLYATQFHSLR